MNFPNSQKPAGVFELIGKIYDAVHVALWSGLFAFVIFFLAFTVPELPRLRAEAQARQVLAIAAEDKGYCEKWGFHAGTHGHSLCVLDLQELRAQIKQRQIEKEY
jgi:hypothetical protein